MQTIATAFREVAQTDKELIGSAIASMHEMRFQLASITRSALILLPLLALLEEYPQFDSFDTMHLKSAELISQALSSKDAEV